MHNDIVHILVWHETLNNLGEGELLRTSCLLKDAAIYSL